MLERMTIRLCCCACTKIGARACFLASIFTCLLRRRSPPAPPMKKVLVLTPLATPLYPPDTGGGKTTKPFFYGRTLAAWGENLVKVPQPPTPLIPPWVRGD